MRLQRNGFDAVLPGIESWYDLGNKSKTGARTGGDKVRQVADHVNMILRHIPFVQTNFVLGLDCDEGRSEEHTSELQSLMRISYAVFCLKKKLNVLSLILSIRVVSYITHTIHFL